MRVTGKLRIREVHSRWQLHVQVARRIQTGIRKWHSAGCRADDGDRCNCNAGWEASIFHKREGRKIRRTYATKAEAIDWRADRQIAKRAGSLRSPSRQTLREAAKSGSRRRRPGRS